MPEGPFLVILREEAQVFEGRRILRAEGYCIDAREADKPLRIGLGFAGGRELTFYSCAARLVEEPLDLLYD